MKHSARIRKILVLTLALCLFAFVLLSGCGADRSGQADSAPDSPDEPLIVVGFSQLGAESDWRNANSESMRATFTRENGYELLFEDGQQKQSNQITAIRSFIHEEVDYIVLAPVTETGWDTVLEEAKEAGIPVIIVDRMVDVADEDLFTCRVGSDFELEAKKACEWLWQFTTEKGIAPETLKIVDIQGNPGASAQIGRTKGLEDACKAHGWELLGKKNGEFTQAMGREAMAAFLKEYPELNVVYCENDNMALGAIEVLEAAGRKTGRDLAGGEILVMSFDGVNHEALSYALDGRISCIAECNPLHGPRIRNLIEMLEKGEMPEKVSYVSEELYCADDTVKWVTVDGNTWPVTLLTEHIVSQKTT